MRTRWSENIFAGLAVLLFVFGFYFTAPTVDQTLDYQLFYRWNFQFLAECLRSGQFPLWNPYIGLGRPFLADTQTACFYPPVYLIVFGGRAGLFVFVYAHCLLGLFAMRALCQLFGMIKPVSYLIGFSFLACGGFTGRLFSGQILFAAAICYLPLLLFYAHRLDTGWNWRLIALYVLTMSLQFLCGHPQVFWFSLLGQTAFLLVRSFGFSRDKLRAWVGELFRFAVVIFGRWHQLPWSCCRF
jgi:hypothetical protein